MGLKLQPLALLVLAICDRASVLRICPQIVQDRSLNWRICQGLAGFVGVGWGWVGWG